MGHLSEKENIQLKKKKHRDFCNKRFNIFSVVGNNFPTGKLSFVGSLWAIILQTKRKRIEQCKQWFRGSVFKNSNERPITIA